MLPDFVIIGAPRSGTTWLYKQLAAHPSVFLPENKEPRFFALESEQAPIFVGPGDDVWSSGLVARHHDYEGLFEPAGDQLKGDASTDYLYRGEIAAPKLRELVPTARIVAILRDPIERAHSAWRLLVHSGYETLGFAEALAAEEQRIADSWAWWWHYSQHGFYARNLAPYLDAFSREQLLLLAYDEIAARPQDVLDEVTAFLGLAPLSGARLAERVNEAPLTRGARQSMRDSALGRALPPAARRLARKALDRFTLYKPEIGETAGARLTRLYERDASELSRLTGRSFELRR